MIIYTQLKSTDDFFTSCYSHKNENTRRVEIFDLLFLMNLHIVGYLEKYLNIFGTMPVCYTNFVATLIQ